MEIVTDEVHIRQLIERARQGEKVVLIGLGNSMRPLLKDGRDFIELEYIQEQEALKKYDIVFYKSYTGTYVLHRIFKVMQDGCMMNGDGNLLVEPAVARKDIYLKAVGIWRNGRYISMSAKGYQAYSIVWMRLLPVRRYLFRIHSLIQKIRKGKEKHEN